MFQCSSASRKFLNSCGSNSYDLDVMFQCSSASRKFLNSGTNAITSPPFFRVSVLFSEPKIPQSQCLVPQVDQSTWFQCSSASRKFLNRRRCVSTTRSVYVSVLFSEPKIPQSPPSPERTRTANRFSALQRAENSSIVLLYTRNLMLEVFQCSSASRKFLNIRLRVYNKTAERFQCSSASRKFLNSKLFL